MPFLQKEFGGSISALKFIRDDAANGRVWGEAIDQNDWKMEGSLRHSDSPMVHRRENDAFGGTLECHLHSGYFHRWCATGVKGY